MSTFKQSQQTSHQVYLHSDIRPPSTVWVGISLNTTLHASQTWQISPHSVTAELTTNLVNPPCAAKFKCDLINQMENGSELEMKDNLLAKPD